MLRIFAACAALALSPLAALAPAASQANGGTKASGVDAPPAMVAPFVAETVVLARDGTGRITSYRTNGEVYTVAYDRFGPMKIVGGGHTTTVERDARGNVTAVTTN